MQKRWIALGGALGGLCIAIAASAADRRVTAITVTNSSAQALAATSGSRLFLSIDNESASATIACAFGATAALNTAGSYTISPGLTRVWGPGTYEVPVPGGAVNCISSAASSPATIESIP